MFRNIIIWFLGSGIALMGLSCIRYSQEVLTKYGHYVNNKDLMEQDTSIFVRKKFEYMGIKKSNPFDTLFSYPRSISFKLKWGIWWEGKKRRYGIAYTPRKWEDEFDSIWEIIPQKKYISYILIVDLKGRKIEEGEIICPDCEGPFIGKYKAYHKNGKVRAQGQFYGPRCGTWYFYNKDGELIKKVQYNTKCSE